MKVCAVCGTTQAIHKHHVYGGSNRKISECNGFTENLCGYHHNLSNEGIHFNNDLDRRFKEKHQMIFEGEKILQGYTEDEARKMFMVLVGKSYL